MKAIRPSQLPTLLLACSLSAACASETTTTPDTGGGDVVGNTPVGNPSVKTPTVVKLETTWKGTVLDLTTGKPLVNASLAAAGIKSPLAIKTDAKGVFSATVPTYGKLPLAVTGTGIATMTHFVDVSDLVEPVVYGIPQTTIDAWYAAAGVTRDAKLTTRVMLSTMTFDPKTGQPVPDVDGYIKFGTTRAYYVDATGKLVTTLTGGDAATYDLGTHKELPVIFLNAPTTGLVAECYSPLRGLPRGTCVSGQPDLPPGAVAITRVYKLLADDLGSKQPDFAWIASMLTSRGCTGCHAPGGTMPSLDYTHKAGDAASLDALHKRITDRPGVINVANPGASLFLTKPLYEEPPNHPQALFLSKNDSTFQAIASWIATGAKR